MRTEPFQKPGYLALIQLLRTADTIWNSSRAFFEAWNISPSQFNVLNLLFGMRDGLSQTELSEQLIVHRSNVTGLIDRLEKRNWVERKNVEGDRRRYQVRLTAQGNALMRKILPRYYASAEKLWEGIAPERISRLTSDLRAAAANSRRLAIEKTGTQSRRWNYEIIETMDREKHDRGAGTQAGAELGRRRTRAGV